MAKKKLTKTEMSKKGGRVVKVYDNKEEYFVQFGSRKNGKILSNEQSSLEDLKDSLYYYCDITPHIELSFFDKMFFTKKYLRNILLKEKMNTIDSFIDYITYRIQIDIWKNDKSKK